MDNNSIIKADGTQYVVVDIGIEQYGIDIKYVDNIVRMQKITRVPKAQRYYEGVINLRGEIVPVMSLRKKFGFEPDPLGDKTRIIILKPEHESIGVIVDAVREVIVFSEAEIEKIYSDGKDDRAKYISEVGKTQEGLVSLLNVNGIITD
ncbi:MAG: purine-binding chemotaxis protein CheW [Lachnospiraceae bacterium]|nr:purine-binding chemotaxis protein CheW [Lachnospiraceae bacterium]